MFHLEGDTIRVAFSFEIHEDEPTRGYRFITDEPADVGIVASENGVWRLCSLRGIGASHARKKARAASPVRRSTTTCWQWSTRRVAPPMTPPRLLRTRSGLPPSRSPTGEGKLTPLEFEMIYATADAA